MTPDHTPHWDPNEIDAGEEPHCTVCHRKYHCVTCGQGVNIQGGHKGGHPCPTQEHPVPRR